MHYTSTQFGIDSSNCFPSRVQAHRHTVTDAADYHTHGLAIADVGNSSVPRFGPSVRRAAGRCICCLFGWMWMNLLKRLQSYEGFKLRKAGWLRQGSKSNSTQIRSSQVNCQDKTTNLSCVLFQLVKVCVTGCSQLLFDLPSRLWLDSISLT